MKKVISMVMALMLMGNIAYANGRQIGYQAYFGPVKDVIQEGWVELKNPVYSTYDMETNETIKELYPLREICEKAGMSVLWSAETPSVVEVIDLNGTSHIYHLDNSEEATLRGGLTYVRRELLPMALPIDDGSTTTIYSE